MDHWTHGKCPITAADFIELCDRYGLAVEVALAQGIMESRLGTSGGRPCDTRNMFNVGNVDSGASHVMPSWIVGMDAYCKLMTHYGLTAYDLINRNFERLDGQGRYASDPQYVQKFKIIINQIRAIMARFC